MDARVLSLAEHRLLSVMLSAFKVLCACIVTGDLSNSKSSNLKFLAGVILKEQCTG